MSLNEYALMMRGLGFNNFWCMVGRCAEIRDVNTFPKLVPSLRKVGPAVMVQCKECKGWPF